MQTYIKTIPETREEMAKLFCGIGSEIGVESGHYSYSILQNEKVTRLYCVDAWETYPGYRDHTRAGKIKWFYDKTKARLKRFGRRAVIVKGFSMEAVKGFPEGSLDFVYIDANHSYKCVLEDIIEWSKCVRVGGIISGHDYEDMPERGEAYKVKEAVHEYLKLNGIEELFVYDEGKLASWMFYKK